MSDKKQGVLEEKSDRHAYDVYAIS